MVTAHSVKRNSNLATHLIVGGTVMVQPAIQAIGSVNTARTASLVFFDFLRYFNDALTTVETVGRNMMTTMRLTRRRVDGKCRPL